jgi:ribosomal-protein-alanine N-acetyltransferase
MQINEVLKGNRIRIRDYRRNDLAFVVTMWLDEENGKYLNDPTKESVDEVYMGMLEKMEDNPFGYYLILEEADTCRLIGTCGIFPCEEKDLYDIGYCIHKDCWNQGYGTEAISLILEWIWQHGGIAVFAEAAKQNPASNRLLQKLGFQKKQDSEYEKYGTDIVFESNIYGISVERNYNCAGDEQVHKRK